MSVPVSISVIWNIAAREAIQGQYQHIDPEHFLNAILKFSELTEQSVDGAVEDEADGRALRRDISSIRKELAKYRIESTRSRRRLRSVLGKGDHEWSGGAIHRSMISHSLFAKAKQKSDRRSSNTIEPTDLLEAILENPTPDIEAVLGEGQLMRAYPAAGFCPAVPYTDLTKQAARGDLIVETERPVELKVVIDHFLSERPGNLLLVFDSESSVKSILAGFAQRIASGSVPRRLKDLSLIRLDAASDTSESGAGYGQVLSTISNASVDPSVVLIYELPADSEPASSLLKTMMGLSNVSIVLVGSKIYERVMKNESKWRKAGKIIWIQAQPINEIPDRI